MSTTGFNPLAAQGLLNRVLTHIIVPGAPQLSVSSAFMAKSLAVLTFDAPAVDQIGTATGIVNSPMPYVMGQIVVNILRSQAVANLYYTQWGVNAVIGTVQAYPDSTTLSAFTLTNVSLLDIDPGAFDGTDPTTKVTMKGVYYINSSLWAGV